MTEDDISWSTPGCLTRALVLQTVAVVALLTDAVVLSGVSAALTACHQVAAVFSCVTQRGAAGQVLLDVAACRSLWEV